jgi:hypothetical protein
MEQVHATIGQLTNKLKNLIAMHKQQKIVIEKLQQENEKLKSPKKPTQLDNITQDAQAMQALVQNLGTDEKKQEIKNLLAEYITQLDKCMAFLAKQ